MELTVAPSVIKLGLVDVRAYRISASQPLLSTGPEPVAAPDVETRSTILLEPDIATGQVTGSLKPRRQWP